MHDTCVPFLQPLHRLPETLPQQQPEDPWAHHPDQRCLCVSPLSLQPLPRWQEAERRVVRFAGWLHDTPPPGQAQNHGQPESHCHGHEEYSGNAVISSKFNVVTFLPIFLFQLFSRVAYLYFLLQVSISIFCGGRGVGFAALCVLMPVAVSVMARPQAPVRLQRLTFGLVGACALLWQVQACGAWPQIIWLNLHDLQRTEKLLGYRTRQSNLRREIMCAAPTPTIYLHRSDYTTTS